MSARRALLLLSAALWFGAGALVGVAMVDADSEDDDMRLDSDGDGMDDGDEARIGTEQNFEWFPNGYLIRWMPQVHWQVHARFQVQAGFGLRHLSGQTTSEAATRLIAEF